MAECNDCIQSKFLSEKIEKLQNEVDTIFERLRTAEQSVIENREKNISIHDLLKKIEKSLEVLNAKLELKQEKKIDSPFDRR